MTFRVISGDCREILVGLDLDPKNVVMVSDPPFNIGYHYATYGDRLNENDYFGLLAEVFQNYPHVIVHYPEPLYRYAMTIQKVPDRVVSWVYNSNTARQHRDIAFFGVKPDFTQVGQEYKNPTDKRIAQRIAEGKRARLYDWFQINQVKNVAKVKTSHPCQMPVEVMVNVIGTLPSQATVVDPFMGSGTTGVACARLGYDFIGIDIDHVYVSIAAQRIAAEVY